MLDQYLVQNLETAARVIDGQAVVITPHDAVLHTLNEVGTFIWARADGRKTVHAVLADVVEEFDVSPDVATADGLRFIEMCVKKGILKTSETPLPVDLTCIQAGSPVT